MIEIDKNFDDTDWRIAENHVDDAESFETEKDLIPWIPVRGGSVCRSQRHYKHGASSLQWNWESGSRLCASGLKHMDVALQAPEGGLQGWFYNETPMEEHLVLNFGTEYDLLNGNPRYSLKHGLNYTGWRGFWFRFEEDGANPDYHASDDIPDSPWCMELMAPEGRPGGSLYLDLFRFQKKVPWLRHHDYQMPFIRGNSWLGFWDSLYYSSVTLNEPLPEQISAEETAAFQTIADRYYNWVFGEDPDIDADPMKIRLEALEEYISLGLKRYDMLNIQRAEDGTITGVPLFANRSEYLPKFRDVSTKIFMPLVFDYKRNRHLSSKDKLMDLFDYMHDQGWAEGSAIQSLEHETLRASGYCHAVYLMRRELKESGRLDREMASMAWYINFGSILNYEDWEVTADELRTHSMYKLIYILCMEDSPEKLQYMKEFIKWMEGALKVRSGFACTIKPDYSGFHHRGIYTVAYVPHAYNTASVLAYLLHGTVFSLSETSMGNLKQALLTQRLLTNKYDVPRALSGRFPHRDDIMAELMQAYAFLALCTSPADEELTAAFMDYWEPASPYLINGVFPRVGSDLVYYDTLGGLQLLLNLAKQGALPAPAPQGCRILPYGAVAVHRRDNWMAAIKAFSQYAWDYEASTSENLYGRYVAYGSIQLLANGSPVNTKASGYALDQGWDWNRWPGTTAIRLPYEQLVYDAATDSHRYFSDETFAGGVSSGKNGMFAMSLHDTQYNPSFRAKKSVFLFDRELLCLGSDIENDDLEHNTETTLFQSHIQSDDQVVWNHSEGMITDPVFTGQYHGEPVGLMDPYGNGYVIPHAAELTVQRGLQHSILHNASRPTQGKYAVAWLNHGTAPASAGYEYTILVQTTPEAVLKYMAEPAYLVHRRDSFAHIAEHTQTHSFAYAVFDASQNLDHGPVCRVSIPSVLIARMDHTSNDRESLVLCMADPDLRLKKPPLAGLGNTVIMDDNDVMIESTPSTLVVELNGNWTMKYPHNQVRILESDDQKTLMAVTCINGLTIEVCLEA